MWPLIPASTGIHFIAFWLREDRCASGNHKLVINKIDIKLPIISPLATTFSELAITTAFR
jgi:hypothetical protein